MEPGEVADIRELLMQDYGYDYNLADSMAWAAYKILENHHSAKVDASTARMISEKSRERGNENDG